MLHLLPVPTRRPRHTITETPPVERALRRLRALQPEAPIDLKELVILGAEVKAARLADDDDVSARQRQRIERFLARRHGDGVDAEAGLALHESGWVRRA